MPLKKHWLIAGFLLCTLSAVAQGDRENLIDHFPDSGWLQGKLWKYLPENGADYAAFDLNDTDWITVALDTPVAGMAKPQLPRAGWYRISFTTSDLFKDSLAALIVDQYVRTRFYLDGRLITQNGSEDGSGLIRPDVHAQVLPVLITAGKRHQLAVRFAYELPSLGFIRMQTTKVPLSIRLESLSAKFKNADSEEKTASFYHGLGFINVTFFILFFLLFIFYPRERLNLYFSLFSLFVFLESLVDYFDVSAVTFNGQFVVAKVADLNGRLIGTMILCFMSLALFGKVLRGFQIYTAIMLIIEFPMSILFPSTRPISIVVEGIFMLMALGIVIYTIWSKKSENLLIGMIGLGVFLINLNVLLLGLFDFQFDFLVLFVNIVAPLSMTIFLALRYGRTSMSLEKQLEEVKHLSTENLEREKEKQEILTTQNERLEAQVTDRTAALNNSLNELRAAQAQLIQSEKMASLGELTAGIAHEIQNPLNFVNNFSEINRDLIGELKTEQAKLPSQRNGKLETELIDDIATNEEKIIHHGKRADAIVKGMLQHSRSDSGTKELSDLNALATEYLALAYHGFRAKNPDFNAELKKELDPAMPKIRIIPQDIGRVLLNLFNNAFYAMMEKRSTGAKDYSPALLLKTAAVPGAAELSVTDNGTGIAGNLAEKIFQPFFTTKPAGSGTGLGLSLSYDIVKSHGGSITVKSEQGRPTTFRIVLPAF